MGFFKRKVNPIFVEDEQYQWGGKRRGWRIVTIIISCVIVITLIVFFATQSV